MPWPEWTETQVIASMDGRAPPEGSPFLDSIDTVTLVGLRDQALIGLLVFSSPASARP
jgi:hypothetical protein